MFEESLEAGLGVVDQRQQADSVGRAGLSEKITMPSSVEGVESLAQFAWELGFDQAIF